MRETGSSPHLLSDIKRIIGFLKRRDRILAKVLVDGVDCPLFDKTRLSDDTLFLKLLRIIVGQQLSISATRKIWERIEELATTKFSIQQRLVTINAKKARQLGLSTQKYSYLKSLSEEYLNGSICLAELTKESNERVIERLCQFRGIGKWTSEMFLIFCLRRLDVFSVNDVGLQRAIKTLYKLHNTEEKILQEISLPWRPYRSVASWFLWNALDEGLLVKNQI